MTRYKDMASPEFPVAENDANRIMHIALPVGNSSVLMAGDVIERVGQVTENDNRNTISISTESREEADKLFNGLSEAVTLKCQLPTGFLVLTLECLQTNLALNGWWTLHPEI